MGVGVRHQSCEVILVIMEYQNWIKVCFLLVSCSAILTECSPHHSSSSYYPSTSLSQSTHTLGNNVYGGQPGQHSYSYTSKGPWGSSYQTVSRTFEHKQHQPWGHKPHKPWHHNTWDHKPWHHHPWNHKPVWPQKPTEKPWVYPTHAPLKPSPISPGTTPTTTTTATTTTKTTSPPITTTTTPPPTPGPDIDLETEYFPFPSPLPVLPLEDIDLPAGPPAILRPGTRGSAVQLYYPTFQHLGTYLQPSYSQYLL